MRPGLLNIKAPAVLTFLCVCAYFAADLISLIMRYASVSRLHRRSRKIPSTLVTEEIYEEISETVTLTPVMHNLENLILM